MRIGPPPPEHESKLGYFFSIDNNALQTPGPDVQRLADLEAAGWFEIFVADSVHGEIAQHANPETRARNAALAEQQPTTAAPLFMFDASRLAGERPDGVRVPGAQIANDEDVSAFERMCRTLFPNPASRDPGSKNYLSNRRDALHVFDAYRLGAKGFITLDTALQRQGTDVRRGFNDFLIMSPEEARECVERDIADYSGP